MNSITVKFKKLSDKAKTPTFGTEFSAGADLYSAEGEIVIAPGETKFIGTGLSTAIPVGTVGIKAYPRFHCRQGFKFCSNSYTCGFLDSFFAVA